MDPSGTAPESDRYSKRRLRDLFRAALKSTITRTHELLVMDSAPQDSRRISDAFFLLASVFQLHPDFLVQKRTLRQDGLGRFCEEASRSASVVVRLSLRLAVEWSPTPTPRNQFLVSTVETISGPRMHRKTTAAV